MLFISYRCQAPFTDTTRWLLLAAEKETCDVKRRKKRVVHTGHISLTSWEIHQVIGKNVWMQSMSILWRNYMIYKLNCFSWIWIWENWKRNCQLCLGGLLTPYNRVLLILIWTWTINQVILVTIPMLVGYTKILVIHLIHHRQSVYMMSLDLVSAPFA